MSPCCALSLQFILLIVCDPANCIINNPAKKNPIHNRYFKTSHSKSHNLMEPLIHIAIDRMETVGNAYGNTKENVSHV